jgi:hypothetical protein
MSGSIGHHRFDPRRHPIHCPADHHAYDSVAHARQGLHSYFQFYN